MSFVFEVGQLVFDIEGFIERFENIRSGKVYYFKI